MVDVSISTSSGAQAAFKAVDPQTTLTDLREQSYDALAEEDGWDFSSPVEGTVLRPAKWKAWRLTELKAGKKLLWREDPDEPESEKKTVEDVVYGRVQFDDDDTWYRFDDSRIRHAKHPDVDDPDNVTLEFLAGKSTAVDLVLEDPAMGSADPACALSAQLSGLDYDDALALLLDRLLLLDPDEQSAQVLAASTALARLVARVKPTGLASTLAAASALLERGAPSQQCADVFDLLLPAVCKKLTRLGSAPSDATFEVAAGLLDMIVALKAAGRAPENLTDSALSVSQLMKKCSGLLTAFVDPDGPSGDAASFDAAVVSPQAAGTLLLAGVKAALASPAEADSLLPDKLLDMLLASSMDGELVASIVPLALDCATVMSRHKETVEKTLVPQMSSRGKIALLRKGLSECDDPMKLPALYVPMMDAFKSGGGASSPEEELQLLFACVSSLEKAEKRAAATKITKFFAPILSGFSASGRGPVADAAQCLLLKKVLATRFPADVHRAALDFFKPIVMPAVRSSAFHQHKRSIAAMTVDLLFANYDNCHMFYAYSRPIFNFFPRAESFAEDIRMLVAFYSRIDKAHEKIAGHMMFHQIVGGPKGDDDRFTDGYHPQALPISGTGKAKRPSVDDYMDAYLSLVAGTVHGATEKLEGVASMGPGAVAAGVVYFHIQEAPKFFQRHLPLSKEQEVKFVNMVNSIWALWATGHPELLSSLGSMMYYLSGILQMGKLPHKRIAEAMVTPFLATVNMLMEREEFEDDEGANKYQSLYQTVLDFLKVHDMPAIEVCLPTLLKYVQRLPNNTTGNTSIGDALLALAQHPASILSYSGVLVESAARGVGIALQPLSVLASNDEVLRPMAFRLDSFIDQFIGLRPDQMREKQWLIAIYAEIAKVAPQELLKQIDVFFKCVSDFATAHTAGPLLRALARFSASAFEPYFDEMAASIKMKDPMKIMSNQVYIDLLAAIAEEKPAEFRAKVVSALLEGAHAQDDAYRYQYIQATIPLVRDDRALIEPHVATLEAMTAQSTQPFLKDQLETLCKFAKGGKLMDNAAIKQLVQDHDEKIKEHEDRLKEVEQGLDGLRAKVRLTREQSTAAGADQPLSTVDDDEFDIQSARAALDQTHSAQAKDLEKQFAAFTAMMAGQLEETKRELATFKADTTVRMDDLQSDVTDLKGLAVELQENIDTARVELGEMAAKLPTPVDYKTCKALRGVQIELQLLFTCGLHFPKCEFTEATPFTTRTRQPNKWLKVGIASANAGIALAMGNFASALGSLKKVFSSGAIKYSGNFEAFTKQPFLTSTEQDELTKQLRSSGYFAAFRFDGISMTWSCNDCAKRNLKKKQRPQKKEEPVADSEPAAAGAASEAAPAGKEDTSAAGKKTNKAAVKGAAKLAAEKAVAEAEGGGKLAEIKAAASSVVAAAEAVGGADDDDPNGCCAIL